MKLSTRVGFSLGRLQGATHLHKKCIIKTTSFQETWNLLFVLALLTEIHFLDGHFVL